MNVAATAVNAVSAPILYHAPVAQVWYACVLIMRVIGVKLLVVALTVSTYDHATATRTGKDRVSAASLARSS